MMTPFKVICVNDKDRPEMIPQSKWLVKNQSYTVIKVAKLLIQGGMVGFKLEGLDIDAYFPYQFFAANRFMIPLNEAWDIEEMLQKILKEAKEEVLELNAFYPD